MLMRNCGCLNIHKMPTAIRGYLTVSDPHPNQMSTPYNGN